MSVQNGSKLLSTKDVAHKLSVHPKLVIRWIKNLSLPAYRFSKEYRFDEKEIDDWIQKHRDNNGYTQHKRKEINSTKKSG